MSEEIKINCPACGHDEIERHWAELNVGRTDSVILYDGEDDIELRCCMRCNYILMFRVKSR
jgi:RNA polymerase subunit RPABC4/transcription elongation factor Spt4